MREKIALLLLRISLGTVFLIFGIGKFQNDIWVQTIKTMEIFQKLPWNVDVSVLFIGIIEIITGIFLIIGFFRRWVSALAALQLIIIIILLNFGELRDIALLGSAIYMIIVKDYSFGIDWLYRQRRSEEKLS